MNALPIFLLPFVTMGIPLLWGVWELTRARNAIGLADDGMIFSGMRRDAIAADHSDGGAGEWASSAPVSAQPIPEVIRFPRDATETPRTLRSVPVDGIV